jgi:catechol 2,3-dioxygenase-like lactoylglutathione lyase family enzyme
MRGLICVALVAACMAAEGADVPTPAADAPNVLGSVGIGVMDLERSIGFYGDVLGMKVLRRFELGYLNEVVLGFPDGSGANVVLMNWPQDGARKYDGDNVKLVFYVHDPAAVIARIRAHGGRIDREAAPIEALNGTVVGLGRDPDNYVVELLGR